MKAKNVWLPVALLTALLQYSAVHAAATLKITYPWVREAPPTARVLAAYMSVENPGESAMTINGISSPDFESAELHRSVLDGGMARMLPVKHLEVPATGAVKLEPGGLHLMLFNPKRTLVTGDTVTLTVLLGNDTSITVNAPVVRQDNGDHSHHHH